MISVLVSQPDGPRINSWRKVDMEVGAGSAVHPYISFKCLHPKPSLVILVCHIAIKYIQCGGDSFVNEKL